MVSLQAVGLKVERPKAKPEKAWKLSQRQGKDGTSKTGQKLNFSSFTGDATTVDSVPHDLNKISVAVPPGSRVTVTMTMKEGIADRQITFKNASASQTMTGRIYVDQDTGEISLVKDPLTNAKADGPITNKFQTRRTLTTLQKDVLKMTQQLSPPLNMAIKAPGQASPTLKDIARKKARRRALAQANWPPKETAWHLTEPGAKDRAKLSANWNRLNSLVKDAHQQQASESATQTEQEKPLEVAKEVSEQLQQDQ